MSEWTYVRAIYDLSLGWFPKDCNEFDKTGIVARLESAKSYVNWLGKDDSVFKLGSEEQLNVYFYPYFGASMYSDGISMHFDDRGTLVMFGNLRDCNREEFIMRLNIFLKSLSKHGIIVSDALVKIE
jgi:hypothetical protein